ncbi:AAA family ATPase [Nocardioides sp. CN2-186]|uniref:AAA family ATPase n=1 Tax=Nocardioides tweenelious TaxID=3156607 RepID=UPI0032B621F9
MPVVVDPDSGTVAALLPALPAGTQGVESGDRLLAWLDTHPAEYVVVLGPHVAVEEALLLCEGLRVSRPTVSLLLVVETVDTHLLTRAMQSGVREVLLVGELDGLAGAVARAEELRLALRGPAGAVQAGRVVTLFSPKGGVGKTTLAVNLALALADGGARRVCLVDLDLAFGDVAISMQLFPTHSIEHAIGSEAVLDLPLVEGLLTRYEGTLMVLAAPNHPDVRDRVTGLLVSRLLRTLRTGFDYIVLDSAPTFDEQTLTALDESDECVMIGALDIPTLKNVKIGLETLTSLSIAAGHHHLVLNRADDAAGLTVAKAEEILGQEIPTKIGTSYDVAVATNSGVPIIASMPDHPVSVAIRDLATRLGAAPIGPADQQQPAVAATDRAAARRLKIRR